MNENKPLNDDVLLDRLVDGELSGNERRQLLESLDNRPEGWRRCAGVFGSPIVARRIGASHANASSITKEPKSPASFPLRQKSAWAAGTKWLALAASLLLAFELGWVQRDRGPSIANSSRNPSGHVASVTPHSKSASPNGAKSGDAVTLFVKDEGGRMQPVRVPLVDAGELDKQLGVQFQTGVPDDIRNQLKNDGYTVQSKRQYAPLWLENGRPMILPVEDTKIMPVSNKVY